MSKMLTSADPPAAPVTLLHLLAGALRVLDAACRGGEGRPTVVRGHRRRAAAAAARRGRASVPHAATRAWWRTRRRVTQSPGARAGFCHGLLAHQGVTLVEARRPCRDAPLAAPAGRRPDHRPPTGQSGSHPATLRVDQVERPPEMPIHRRQDDRRDAERQRQRQHYRPRERAAAGQRTQRAAEVIRHGRRSCR